jgi:hypothetical protein
VTATNTGAPTATPSPTSTSLSFAPETQEDALAQQPFEPLEFNDLVEQQAGTEQASTPQQIAALKPLPTPTLMLVAEREIIPENCIELIDNGSFEARGMGWSQQGSKISPVYTAPTLETPGALQSGLAIRLGLVDDVNVAGISATQQLVHLPADRNKITLHFRYFPQYQGSPSPGDFQYVDIYHGESGQFVGRALGVQRNDRAWIERQYDLSGQAGEAVRLFFMVSNDGVEGNIAMFVDDVSLLACHTPKLQPPKRPATDEQPQPSAAGSSTPQPLGFSNTIVLSPQAESEPEVSPEIMPVQGFSFGRTGGLLAVLGIAGAALVLLPLTRRFIK